MPFDPQSVGPIFDIGISLRPGAAPLACKNREGKIVNLSAVAYMKDAGRQSVMEETSDLQRKSDLIRLSSANLIDREFTNYPQATQGSWVGGEGQRIFNDPTKYWQGRGLMWPLTDFVPQEPGFVSPPITDDATAGPPFGRVVGGTTLNNGPVFSFFYKPAASATQIVSIEPGGTRLVDNSAGVAGISDLVIASGYIFFSHGSATPFVVYWSNGTASTLLYTGPAGSRGTGFIYAGTAGAVNYLALPWVNTAGADGRKQVRLIELGEDTATLPTVGGFTDFALPPAWDPIDIKFIGSTVYVLCRTTTAGNGLLLLAYSIAAATLTTIVETTEYSAGQMGTALGALVLWLATTGTNPIIDVYVLAGAGLSLVQSLPPQIFGTGAGLVYSQVLTLGLSGAAQGPYVFLPVTYTDGNLTDIGPYNPSVATVVYAFNVETGAIFTVFKDFGPFTPILGQFTLPSLAVFPVQAVPIGTGNVTGQWGLVTILGPGRYQYAAYGLVNPETLKLVPGAGRVTSSLFDFTSASPKLWRQLVITHDPIPASDALAQVRCSVWLDQVPDNLTGAPAGTVLNLTPGSTQTVVPINRLARKLVYMLDWYATFLVPGPNLGEQVPGSPPRPISVAAQVATGWVNKMTLNCSSMPRVNSQAPNDFCFTRQQIDSTAAYNFLRQVWRVLGGECVQTLPNGDIYNAVIEELRFYSPKPLSTPAGDASKEGQYEVMIDILTREDA